MLCDGALSGTHCWADGETASPAAHPAAAVSFEHSHGCNAASIQQWLAIVYPGLHHAGGCCGGGRGVTLAGQVVEEQELSAVQIPGGPRVCGVAAGCHWQATGKALKACWFQFTAGEHRWQQPSCREVSYSRIAARLGMQGASATHTQGAEGISQGFVRWN